MMTYPIEALVMDKRIWALNVDKNHITQIIVIDKIRMEFEALVASIIDQGERVNNWLWCWWDWNGWV